LTIRVSSSAVAGAVLVRGLGLDLAEAGGFEEQHDLRREMQVLGITIITGMAEAGVDARGPERLEAFSDGVFAIAITLLVLEVHVPPIDDATTPGAVVDVLVRQWPGFVGYLISFITIGNAWINHHNLLRHIARVSHGVLIANLLLLLAIGFMPFPTALLAETLGRPSQQVGVVVYAGAFALTAVAFNLLWLAVKRVLKPGASTASVAAIDRSYRLGPPISVAALFIAFVNPTVGIVVIAGLVVLYLLPRSSGT
jgi:uncharacterized membrane protein